MHSKLCLVFWSHRRRLRSIVLMFGRVLWIRCLCVVAKPAPLQFLWCMLPRPLHHLYPHLFLCFISPSREHLFSPNINPFHISCFISIPNYKHFRGFIFKLPTPLIILLLYAYQYKFLSSGDLIFKAVFSSRGYNIVRFYFQIFSTLCFFFWVIDFFRIENSFYITI